MTVGVIRFRFSRKVKENLRESGVVEGRVGKVVEESVAEANMFSNGLSLLRQWSFRYVVVSQNLEKGELC